MIPLEQYGPWAIAFALLLAAFKEVIFKILGTVPKTDKLADALTKLSEVLTRMENTQNKVADKTVEIRTDQALVLEVVRATDLRTQAIANGVDDLRTRR